MKATEANDTTLEKCPILIGHSNSSPNFKRIMRSMPTMRHVDLGALLNL